MAWAGLRYDIDRYRTLAAAICFLLIAQALDFISTTLAMAFIPGAIEANPVMRNPVTLKFLPVEALVVKGIYGLTLVPCVAALYAGTRQWILATLPLWWNAYNTMTVVFANFVYLWKRG